MSMGTSDANRNQPPDGNGIVILRTSDVRHPTLPFMGKISRLLTVAHGRTEVSVATFYLCFKWQRSQTGNAKFHFSRFRQKFAFIAFGPRILPIRTTVIAQSLADRVGFSIQQCIQCILDGLPNQSIEMRPNLFFIDFNRSGDCLFISCATFSMACFPFF